MQKNEKNGVVYFTFKNLQAAGVVRHGFSSRIGGISSGHFAAMNLGPNTGDEAANVQENYRLFCYALGVDVKNIVLTDQRHTTNIQNIKHYPGHKKHCPENIDGLITDIPGAVLVTYYADCVPLLLCDPKRRVIANCHAGWRGTVHNMAGKAVEKMAADYGCNPRDILAGIGPSISCKNFEVGAEVAQEFKLFLPFCAEFVYNSNDTKGKFHIDLWGINRRCLTAAGVPEENIETAGMCTFDDETHFFSHRRSGTQRGGLAAFIALEL